MSQAWTPYVPYNIAREILQHPGLDPVGHEQRSDAVALFADVSGFTAMSEALGHAGRAGTEELTDILNAYFATMIDLIQAYGGIIGQFGGDSLTVLFPYDPDTRGAAIRRAMQCALDMQASMDRYRTIDTRAGKFSLAMKAGLAEGPFLCTTVGNPAVGLKYLIAGRALDLCAEAEHQTHDGEVVVHDALLVGAEPVRVADRRAGFSLVTRLDPPAPQHPLDVLDRPLTDDEQALLAAYLPPVVAQRLERGQRGFVNEHRKVSVLFVSFGGFDYDGDPTVTAKLQGYFEAVLAIIHRYEGYLNKVDMGDKGSKYIVLFGAPIGYEDNDERALRCALELRAIPNVVTRIGVNTGFVYCGLVGSDLRQEYTVMGDAVNLAARLMQVAAPGQILVSRATQQSRTGDFAWERLEPLRVKGRSEPIQVFTLEQFHSRSILQTQELEYSLPMVGRAAELSLIETKIEQVLDGHGQIVGITADAGMGKSRLSAEAIQLAHAQGLSGYGGECQSYGTTTSYLVWHHIWQTFFSVDPAWPAARQHDQLAGMLAAVDPALANRLPLLGPALNLTLPDNDLTATLDAKLRKSSLESLLVTCLRARAGAQPLLLVLEDAHWIDPLAFDLLEVIARNIVDTRVLILLIYRPPELSHIALDRLRGMSHFTELALTEFTPDEAQQLIQLKLQRLFAHTGDPSPELVTLITAKAQGNPFYIDEMMNLLQDEHIDPHNIDALTSLELPDSLHSLIVSRIDRLLEDQRIALKVASVIGRLFKSDWLWRVYPQLGQPDRVRQQLASLNSQDFLVPSGGGEPEVEYLFKHIVTQEVAYEGLAVATRARLHEEVGSFIERTYPDTIDRYLDLLAYHYHHSENVTKQREYFRRAGDAAQQTYANDAAVGYYQRLLPLLPPDEHPPVLLKLGKVWELTGKWDECEQTYQQALALAETAADEALQAQCHNELGRLLSFKGTADRALAALETARDQFARLDDRQGIVKTLANMANVYLRQGEIAQGQSHLEEALALANAIDDRELAGLLLGNLGVCYGMQGEPARALEFFEQQAQIKAELGDKRGASLATGNMGVALEDLGDYARAMDCYMHQWQVMAEVGDQRNVGIAVGNMGVLYGQQGEYTQARRCYALQLEIALELGNRRVAGYALGHLAGAYLAQGRETEAERPITAAIALARSQDLRYDLCQYLHLHADLLFRQGDTAALSSNAEALELAAAVKRKDVEFPARVLAVRLRAATGQADTAAAVTELEEMAHTWRDDDEQAALHYAIWQFDPAREADRQRAADLYRDLFARTPNVIFRDRYAELTGDTLEPAAPLPGLPAAISRRAVDLDALLARTAVLVGPAPD